MVQIFLECFLEFCCFVVHSDRCHLTGWAAYCDDVQEREPDFLEAWVAGVASPRKQDRCCL